MNPHAKIDYEHMLKHMDSNFNFKHPELQLGEMWLLNADGYEYAAYSGYKTRRLGNVAYDSQGKPSKDRLHPLFIQTEEYIAQGETKCI